MNYDVQQQLGITPFMATLQEVRLIWYKHVMHRKRIFSGKDSHEFFDPMAENPMEDLRNWMN